MAFSVRHCVDHFQCVNSAFRTEPNFASKLSPFFLPSYLPILLSSLLCSLLSFLLSFFLSSYLTIFLPLIRWLGAPLGARPSLHRLCLRCHHCVYRHMGFHWQTSCHFFAVKSEFSDVCNDKCSAGNRAVQTIWNCSSKSLLIVEFHSFGVECQTCENPQQCRFTQWNTPEHFRSVRSKVMCVTLGSFN